MFTADEEVEKMPMQYPVELRYETRQQICDIEGITFEAGNDGRLSVLSGRNRRSSFQSNKLLSQGMNKRKQSGTDGSVSSDAMMQVNNTILSS